MKSKAAIVVLALCLSCFLGCKEKPTGTDGHTLPMREIQLKNRSFTPKREIPVDIVERAEKMAQEGRLAGDKVHLLAQFGTIVEAPDRERLQQEGITLLEPIGPQAWFVVVARSMLPKLASVKELAWADLLQVKDKLAPDLQDQPVPYPYQQRQEGRATYSLLFHRDVTAQEVLALSKRIDLKLENFDSKSFSFFHTTVAEIPSATLDQLAREDIICWIEPSPGMDEDQNVATAQPLSNVDDVHAIPYNLDGTGINVGVWEAGNVVYAAHLDLAPRVTVQAGQGNALDDHAAHVAGTIGASGVNVPNAQGMAPNSTLLSWNSVNDAAEMLAAATPPGANQPPAIDVSNHSYDVGIGWARPNTGNFTNNQNLFGAYDVNAQGFDNVIASTNLIVCKNAGNDRNNSWDGVTVIPGFPAGTAPPNDCFQNAYPGGAAGDCLPPRAGAKNVISVGAMNGGGAIAGFSSFGPMDDGRLKPDIVAQGSNMLSLASNVFDDRNGDGIDDAPNTNTSSTTLSGTSMSTPVVSGISALLLELADSMNIALTNAGMKALLLQSARDVQGIGQSRVGPDYATGYGIVDALRASNLLREGGLATGILAGTGAGNAWTRTLYVPAGVPELKVTLAWSDQPGNPAAAAALVNDLDLVLLPPGGAAPVTPWGLNPANPTQAAVRNAGRDSINNVEQVSVLNPAPGTWTVQVSALAGKLPFPNQAFAVAGILPASDVVLVMDKSGSMSLPSGTPGINKMQALRIAANEFIDLLDLLGGHSLGLVKFDAVVQPFAPPFDLQALSAANLGNAHTAIDGMVAGGRTNIVAGVQAADVQLAAAPAPSPRRAVVVFSDGKHNEPAGSNLADIGPVISAGGYRFYSIGFGTDVDDEILSQVATANQGIHVNEQDLNAIQLTKYFLTVGALVHNLQVLSDPTFEVGNGEQAKLAVDVIPDDQSLIVAVNWTGMAQDMDISLLSPEKTCQVPLKAGQGVDIRKGKNYLLIKVDLPFLCKGKNIQAGQWMVQATPKGIAGAGKESVDIMVLGHSNVTLVATVKVDVRARTRTLLAALAVNGKVQPRLENAEVVAYILPPLPQTGDSRKQDDGATQAQKPTDRAKRVKELKLADDGKNGDPKANDGQYAVSLPQDMRIPGVLQVRIVSKFRLRGSLLSREKTVTLYMK